MAIDSDKHTRSTAAPPSEAPEIYGPWNPGVESTLPSEFLPLSTLFGTANVSTSIDELQELSDFCGLPIEKLSTFKPERLALHEVLIRVMADLSVPDGKKYEDLGVNFRQMTAAIMDKHIAPKMSEINGVFELLKREAADFIDKAQNAVPSFDKDVKATRERGRALVAADPGRPEKCPRQDCEPHGRGSGPRRHRLLARQAIDRRFVRTSVLSGVGYDRQCNLRKARPSDQRPEADDFDRAATGVQ